MKTTTSVIIALAFVGASCVKDNANDCIEYRQSTISNVIVPDTISVNQESKIKVTVLCGSGCATFNKFEETNSGFTKSVKAIVKYEGCECTQIASFVDTGFVFKPTAPGTYLFRFIQEDNSVITDSAVVI
jgi:hypothetical protein